MSLLHGNPPAAVTDEFHGRQFVFADVLSANLGGAAKTAFGFIAAGVA
jgi:hypothetical protein